MEDKEEEDDDEELEEDKPMEDETDPFKVVKDQIAKEKDYPDGGEFEANFLQKKKEMQK